MVGLEQTSEITIPIPLSHYPLHPYAMGWLSPLHQVSSPTAPSNLTLSSSRDGDIFLGPSIKTSVLSLSITHCHKEGTHSHCHSPNHASCRVSWCWMTASLTDGQTDTTVATTSTLLWFRTDNSHRWGSVQQQPYLCQPHHTRGRDPLHKGHTHKQGGAQATPPFPPLLAAPTTHLNWMQLLTLLIFLRSLINFTAFPTPAPTLSPSADTRPFPKRAFLSLSTFTNSAVPICPVNYFVQ